MLSVAALILSASIAAPSRATPAPEVAKDVREIPIDAARAKKVYRIRTAPGYPTTVEFEEAFTAPPTCGNCCSEAGCSASSSALFRMDVFAEQHLFTIKPRMAPGRQPDGTLLIPDDFITTVTAPLANMMHLTFQVELTDHKKADAHVVVTLPTREEDARHVLAQIERARTALEKTYSAKRDAEFVERALRFLAEPHACVSITAQIRHDDLVLRLQELCRLGAHMYVRAAIENRGQEVFAIGEVRLHRVNERAALDAQRYWSTTELSQESVATLVLAVPTEAAPKRFDLTVSELGGRGRYIGLRDFGF